MLDLIREDSALDLPLRYDYSRIAEEHRGPVMLSARRIKAKAERAKRDLVEMGKELAEVKDRLGHGYFLDWVAGEFGMSDRTAELYMRVYEVWGGKIETVSILSDSAMMILAAPSVSVVAREQAVAEAKTTGKSPTKARVKEIVEAHKPETPAQFADRFRLDAAANRAPTPPPLTPAEQADRARRKAEAAAQVQEWLDNPTPSRPAIPAEDEPGLDLDGALDALYTAVNIYIALAEAYPQKADDFNETRLDIERHIGWLDEGVEA